MQLQLPFPHLRIRYYPTSNHPCDPISDEEMDDCYLFPDSCRERLLPWCVQRRLPEVEFSNSTSALIAFFIWKTHRDVRQATSSSLQVCVSVWSCESGPNLLHSQSVLRIFIESAAIWIFFIFITFVVYLANDTAAYIPLYLVRPRFAPKNPLSTHLSHDTDQPRPWNLLLYDDNSPPTPQHIHRRRFWPLQATVQLQDRFQGAQLIRFWLRERPERTHGLQLKTNR